MGDGLRGEVGKRGGIAKFIWVAFEGKPVGVWLTERLGIVVVICTIDCPGVGVTDVGASDAGAIDDGTSEVGVTLGLLVGISLGDSLVGGVVGRRLLGIVDESVFSGVGLSVGTPVVGQLVGLIVMNVGAAVSGKSVSGNSVSGHSVTLGKGVGATVGNGVTSCDS